MNIRKSLPIIVLVLILASVLIAPKYLTTSDQPESNTVVRVDCSLNQGTCSFTSKHFGEVDLTVTPSSLVAFKPLAFTLNTTAETIDQVSVSIEGKDMYMGPNIVKLKGSQGIWTGTGMIPLCSVDKNMMWLIKLTLAGSSVETMIFEVTSAHE